MGQDSGVSLGCDVYVCNEFKGVVRYIGPIGPANEQVIGVELEAPDGDSDGSIGGERYFDCEENHGLFVAADDVAPLAGANAAASAVQSASRKLLARKMATKERNSKVWNKLDNMNEQLMIRRSLQLQNAFGPDAVAELEEPDVEVENDYDGPRLKFPLTQDQVLAMLEHFKQGKVLHLKYAVEMLRGLKELFAKESTLQECSMVEGMRMTVVGDIHGQIQDLYSIFTINGLPGPNNQYLFNGDFVDRGPNGAEVFFSIGAFKLLYPTAVRLNRGNHESRQQNRLMGFEEELLGKYTGPNGRALLQIFHNVFDVLPLCALIQKKVFVVHGGLFSNDGVTFDHIRGISRKREPPIHSPAFEDKLFEAMLWSDPRTIQGRQLSARGAGVEFGQAVTHEFLRTNKAALVIRSHECVREGFELLHSGRLITLFSASRYCGMQTNKGAFLTIGPELQPEIQQFYAHSVADTHWDNPEASQAIEQKLEDDAVAMIVERVIDNKPSLYWHYTRQDKERTGTVTRLQWSNGLKLVLQLDVPFLSYAHRLVDLEGDETINYTKFLERYRVQMGGNSSLKWQDSIVDTICEKMFVAMGAGDVQQAFRFFDDDKNGFIEYEEFVNTLKRLDIGLSDNQIFELMRGLDKDCDSVIDLEEFVSRFEVVFARLNGSGGTCLSNSGASGADADADAAGGGASSGMGADDATAAAGAGTGPMPPKEILPLMRRAVTALFKTYGSVDKVFTAADKAGKGHCTCEELTVVLAAVLSAAAGVDASPAEVAALAAAMDSNSDGVIDRAEMSAVLRVTDRRGSKGRQSASGDAQMQSDVRAAIEAANAAADLPAATLTTERSSSSLGSGGGGKHLMQDVGWQEGVLQNIANFLYQNRQQLASAFRTFDVDNDGHISAEEFSQGMRTMNNMFDRPLTDDQIGHIMKALDEDGDGRLSYKEFLQGFQIVDTKTGAKTGVASGPGIGGGGGATAGAAGGGGGAAAPQARPPAVSAPKTAKSSKAV